jgi:hypothetical protein
MPRYSENLYARNLTPLKISKQFNIQEPFELNQNVSSGFVYARRFKSLCQDAEKVCRQMKPTSPLSSLFGDFTAPTKSAAIRTKVDPENVPRSSTTDDVDLPNPSVAIVFQLRPNAYDVTRDLIDQAVNAAGIFLGRLLSFSYGITITEASPKPAEDGPPTAKKPRNNYDDQQLEEDMVMHWNRTYEISFPFDVFHPLRDTVNEEIRSHHVEVEVGKSLLDRERQITSILAIKQLDGCSPPFYTPGGVVITCHLDRSREESLVTLNLMDNRRNLHPVAFRQLAEGLSRYAAPILGLFLSQNLFPFSVYLTKEWNYS